MCMLISAYVQLLQYGDVKWQCGRAEVRHHDECMAATTSATCHVADVCSVCGVLACSFFGLANENPRICEDFVFVNI